MEREILRTVRARYGAIDKCSPKKGKGRTRSRCRSTFPKLRQCFDFSLDAGAALNAAQSLGSSVQSGASLGHRSTYSVRASRRCSACIQRSKIATPAHSLGIFSLFRKTASSLFWSQNGRRAKKSINGFSSLNPAARALLKLSQMLSRFRALLSAICASSRPRKTNQGYEPSFHPHGKTRSL